MGRQTVFFMSESDEAEFLGVIRDRHDSVLDRHGNELTVEDVQRSPRRQFFVALPGSSSIVMPGRYIEQMSSEVVELDLCRRQDDKDIEDGRIWAALRYYDSSRALVAKSKQFEGMYSFYAAWIRKHYKISRDRRYYIGSDAYRKYKEEGYTMRNGVYRVEFA